MGFTLLMKKASLAGAFFVSAIWLSGAQAFCPMPDGLTSVAVQRVVDGDTLRLSDGRSVRMIGLNTPELGKQGRSDEPFAVAARKRLETLVAYLRELGIEHFDVDTSDYDPLQIRTYTRPDRADAMKLAHEAAAYEEWVKKQVQISIDDPRPSVSDEEARRIFAAKREALRQRVR